MRLSNNHCDLLCYTPRTGYTFNQRWEKAQLEAQSPAFATSIIAQVALRTKVIKICCAFFFG